MIVRLTGIILDLPQADGTKVNARHPGSVELHPDGAIRWLPPSLPDQRFSAAFERALQHLVGWKEIRSGGPSELLDAVLIVEEALLDNGGDNLVRMAGSADGGIPLISIGRDGQLHGHGAGVNERQGAWPPTASGALLREALHAHQEGWCKAVLKDAAEHYYDDCRLYEDEDLDQTNTLEVIRRAFSSSYCNDFAAVLSEMTGWPTAQAVWPYKNYGLRYHTLVRAPDGLLLEVSGLVSEEKLEKRHSDSRDGTPCEIKAAEPEIQILGSVDDAGFDEEKRRIAGVIRALPYAPFNTPEFRQMSQRPLAGVDFPLSEEPEAADEAERDEVAP